ncbi:YhgE/Pip domain-containing protein [Nocardia sp. NPDC055321]
MNSPAGQDENNARRARTVRTWVAPVVVLSLFMALFATLYMSYVANPEENLHDFPIALVNRDEGDVLGGRPTNVGNQLAEAFVANIPSDKVDLRQIGIDEARQQLQLGKIYGAIIIPSDFTKRLGILGTASVVAGEVEKPQIVVETNPRASTFAAQIVGRIAEQAMPRASEAVGKTLVDTVQSQLATAPADVASPTLSGAALVTLADPIEVNFTQFAPLAGGTGNGLIAFFYTLLVLLAGFIGAMIIHTMVDAAWGFVPAEFGPLYLEKPPVGISRTRTLLVKWGVMAVAAPIVSALYLIVATALNVPIDRGWALFLYTLLATFAVGVTALAILAAFGTAGLMLNTILFIVLGLPSSGGTVPIEATPRSVEWLSAFEPMHQVYLGVRAILYFNADLGAGLGRGILMAVLGLGIGLVLGLGATMLYDRRGLTRSSTSKVASS